jgi:2,3-bisphosphoglycerate-independent phosphoglycerate mutase
MSNLKIKKYRGKKPVVVAILDGWGLGNDYNGNAITRAKTPTFDFLWKEYPHTELEASGKNVGLSPEQSGNSEAGHLNLGAGRIVDQDAVAISRAISTGVFFKNLAFKNLLDHVQNTNGKIHLVGLLSGWQSAHSDPDHILALLTLFRQKKIKNVYLHLFTDGRDSYQFGALKFLEQIKKMTRNNEKVATVCGRYYAMDRMKKWNRTEKAYDLMTSGVGSCYADSAEAAIKNAYDRGETDEFVLPTTIVEGGKCDDKGICKGGKPIATIDSGDGVVFFNLRSDRARQFTKVFVQNDFEKRNKNSFKRKKILKNISFVALTDFGPDLEKVMAAFPSRDVKNSLPKVLGENGVSQLYISETEKYAHVTYFFNGGFSDTIGGEDRKIISSPDVASYDTVPGMSSAKIVDFVVKDLKNKKHDFILMNLASPDMIGHTGNLTAGIKACEVVDKNLKKILTVIKKQKGVLIIVADHGNIEEMINKKTDEVNTQHTSNRVPFIVFDANHKDSCVLEKRGVLGNVAPTILDLMNIEKVKEMNLKTLIKNKKYGK